MANGNVYINSINALKVFMGDYDLFVSKVAEEIRRINEVLYSEIEDLEQFCIQYKNRIDNMRREYQEKEYKDDNKIYWQKINESEELLNRMNQLLQKIKQQEYLYRQAMNSIQQLIEDNAPKAHVFLEDCISDIEKYIALSPPGELETKVPTKISEKSDTDETETEFTIEDCPLCKGRGWVPSVPFSFNPEWFEIRANPDRRVPCPRCGGTGKLKRKKKNL